MSTSIDDFLAQARRGGEMVSSGCFTLDVSRANHILREHQAASPNFFLYKFVQAAVAGGVQGVDILEGRAHVHVTWKGCQNLRIRYEDVIAALSSPQLQLSQEPLAMLAAGLNAALSLGPPRIEWRSYREEPATLRLTGEGVQLEPLERIDFPHPDGVAADYGFYLQFPPYEDWRASLRGIFSGHLDRGDLKRRLAFCPIPVRSGPNSRWNELALGDWPLNTVMDIRTTPAKSANRLASPRGDGPAGRITALFTRPRTSRFRFIHFGVEVDTFQHDFGEPAVEAVLTTEGLKLDLAQAQLVRSSELEALQRNLVRELRR